MLEPAHFILLLLCRLKNLVDTEDTLEIHLGKKPDSYIYTPLVLLLHDCENVAVLYAIIDREAWSSGVS